jgi:hypothetical protein
MELCQPYVSGLGAPADVFYVTYEMTKWMISAVHFNVTRPMTKNERKEKASKRSSMASTRCGNLL